MADPQPTKLNVAEVMTKEVVAIDVNDTVDVIADLFEKYDYNGMPVIDSSHVVRGIISTHDLILHSSEIHLPTMLRLMEQIARGKGDRRVLEEHFAKLRDIKATSIMRVMTTTIRQEAPLEEAAQIFADYPAISTLCVVDAEKKLVGIISHRDIIGFFSRTYLGQVTQQKKAGPNAASFQQFPTKSQSEVEEVFANVKDEFLLVQKSRPLLWKYSAIAMFAGGLLAATALIIRIVTKG